MTVAEGRSAGNHLGQALVQFRGDYHPVRVLAPKGRAAAGS